MTFEVHEEYNNLINFYERMQQQPPEWATVDDVFPPVNIVAPYLERNQPEDPKMTQLDILKANSIDILYSLTIV